MVIHPRDNALIVGTHGRAIWILDHLEPIQEYAAAQAAATDAKLFTHSDRRCSGKSKDDQNDEFWGHQFFLGENPPTDAVIQFHLKKPVDDLEAARSRTRPAARVRELTVPANRNAGRHPDRVLGHARRSRSPPAGAGGGGRRRRPGGGGGGGGGGGRVAARRAGAGAALVGTAGHAGFRARSVQRCCRRRRRWWRRRRRRWRRRRRAARHARHLHRRARRRRQGRRHEADARRRRIRPCR